MRFFLRAIVNLDPYSFVDDLAEEIAPGAEGDRRSPEEVLLAAIDGTEDGNLTGFVLRLALTSHVGIPRNGEIDFLTEAEAVFASPQPKAVGTNKAKNPTPIKTDTKKTGTRKKTAA